VEFQALQAFQALQELQALQALQALLSLHIMSFPVLEYVGFIEYKVFISLFIP
jgi:hypothetical protein